MPFRRWLIQNVPTAKFVSGKLMFNTGRSARFRMVLGRPHNLELGVVMDSGLGLGLFLEELLQDSDDVAGFRQVAVLCPGILQQHIPVSTAL